MVVWMGLGRMIGNRLFMKTGTLSIPLCGQPNLITLARLLMASGIAASVASWLVCDRGQPEICFPLHQVVVYFKALILLLGRQIRGASCKIKSVKFFRRIMRGSRGFIQYG